MLSCPLPTYQKEKLGYHPTIAQPKSQPLYYRQMNIFCPSPPTTTGIDFSFQHFRISLLYANLTDLDDDRELNRGGIECVLLAC